MNILYILVPIALLLAAAGIGGFLWAVRHGQYDDTETPALRVLLEDENATPTAPGVHKVIHASPSDSNQKEP